MADTKITALTADTSPTSDDLVVTVNDPGGTPANKKVTAANLITKAHGLSDGIVKVATGVMTSDTTGIDTTDLASGVLDTDLTTVSASDDTIPSAKATKTYADTKEPVISSGTTGQYWRGDKSWQTLDKTAVGLGSVTNDAQLKAADLDTDGTLAANSDLKVASQKATKTYADTKKTNSMSTNKLLGRGTAGTGVIEEITLGTNLSLSGTTLNATGGGSVTVEDENLIIGMRFFGF